MNLEETSQSNPTGTQRAPRTFKKANAEIIKMKPGQEVEGTFTGTLDGPWVDKKTGEEKTLTRMYFTREDGEKFIIFEDGGLRNAMANAGVKEGMYIKVLKQEKSDLGGGRTVNNYDIFIAE